MVKWTSCLGSNEEFRVRYLVGLLIEEMKKRKGNPIGDGSRLEAGRAISNYLAGSTPAPSAELLETRSVSQHGVRGVRGRHVCL